MAEKGTCKHWRYSCLRMLFNECFEGEASVIGRNPSTWVSFRFTCPRAVILRRFTPFLSIGAIYE